MKYLPKCKSKCLDKFKCNTWLICYRNEITDLLCESPQCVYAGFDPTANSLHVGNLLVIINLLHWQRGGHNVIALVRNFKQINLILRNCKIKEIVFILNMSLQLGGATGYIGDPSGKTSDRVALQSEVINQNISCIKKNLESVFENHQKYIWAKVKSRELKPIR